MIKNSFSTKVGFHTLITFFVISALFCSCKNFFNGTELKDYLDEAIAYANAKTFTVKIIPEKTEMGSVSGSSEKTVKVTDEISLSFDCSSSYAFSKWTAYVDGVEDVDGEYVLIYSPYDLYTKAKILKYSENIIIRPECSEFLKIVKVTPDWGYVSPRDTSIEVEFNASVNIDNFRFSIEDFEQLGLTEGEGAEKKIIDSVQPFFDSKNRIYAYTLYEDESTLAFKNIQITCEEENYLKYFMPPFVSGNKLYIPVDQNNMIPVLDTKNISVTLSKEIVSGTKIAMKTGKNWLYKINSVANVEKDITPPGVEKLIAAKNKDSLNDVNKFSEKAFSEFVHNQESGESDYIRNCVIEKFVFSFSASDKESGIKKICISEQQTNRKDGSAPFVPEEIPTEYTGSQLRFSEDGLTASIETEYKIKNDDEGAFLIRVWAVNNNDKESEKKEFLVINHTTLSLDGWKLYNLEGELESFSYYETESFNLITQGSVLYKDVKLKTSCRLYCGGDPLNISTDITSKLSHKTGDPENKFTFYFNPSVYESAFTKTSYLKVVVEDEAGIKNEFLQIVPGAPEFVYGHVTRDKCENVYQKDYIECANKTSFGVNLLRVYYTNPTGAKALRTNEYTWDSYHNMFKDVKSSYDEYCLSFYTSDYGNIVTGNVSKKIENIEEDGKTTNGLELKDKNGNDITFEITEIAKEKGYSVYKVKTSGLVPAIDKKNGENAGFLLENNGNFEYFEGTEHKFIVPNEKIIKSGNWKLYALDSSHITGESKEKQDDSKSPYGWKYIKGNIANMIMVFDYKHVTDKDNYNKYAGYTNENYTNEYIRILYPEKPDETPETLSLKNTATVYYKKAFEYTQILEDNAESVSIRNYTEKVKNPGALVDTGILTYEDVEKFDSVEIPTTGSESWYIPVFKLETGSYIFFVKITDSEGKTNYGSFYYEKNESPYEITKDSFTLSNKTIKAKYLLDNNAVIYRRFGVDYINNQTWSEAGKGEVYENNYWNSENTSFPDSKSFNSATLSNTSTWLKIYCHEADYGGWYRLFGRYDARASTDTGLIPLKFYYHAPVYIYPNGTSAPSFTSINVGLKNIIEGKALSIICTQPALAQTFIYPENLGQDDCENWEYHCSREQVLKPVEIPAGGSNYEIPEIKKGYYYCVIVRFSDGSTMMNTVKKN